MAKVGHFALRWRRFYDFHTVTIMFKHRRRRNLTQLVGVIAASVLKQLEGTAWPFELRSSAGVWMFVAHMTPESLAGFVALVAQVADVRLNIGHKSSIQRALLH